MTADQRATAERWLSTHVRACEALERAGKESPRSETRVAAMREMADRLPRDCEIRVGSGLYGIKTERLHGMNDAFDRVGRQAMERSGLGLVTLSGHPHGALAYVMTGSARSTMTMTDKGQSLRIETKDRRSEWRDAAGKPGWTVNGASRTNREMTEMTTLHELGHVFHGAALRAETGKASSAALDRDGSNRVTTNGGTVSSSPSEYGRSNGAEYVAEAFTLMMTGVVPRDEVRNDDDYNRAISVASSVWRSAVGTEPPSPLNGPYAGRTY